MNFLELVKARYSARKYAGRSVEIENWSISWSVYAWLPRQLISNRGGLNSHR